MYAHRRIFFFATCLAFTSTTVGLQVSPMQNIATKQKFDQAAGKGAMIYIDGEYFVNFKLFLSFTAVTYVSI